jgi:transcription factor WhiB
MDQAACGGMVPSRSKGTKASGDDTVPKEPDIFFPYRGQDKTTGQSVCFSCPVRLECIGYSEKTGSKVGMWGGIMKQKGKQ